MNWTIAEVAGRPLRDHVMNSTAARSGRMSTRQNDDDGGDGGGELVGHKSQF